MKRILTAVLLLGLVLGGSTANASHTPTIKDHYSFALQPAFETDLRQPGAEAYGYLWLHSGPRDARPHVHVAFVGAPATADVEGRVYAQAGCRGESVSLGQLRHAGDDLAFAGSAGDAGKVFVAGHGDPSLRSFGSLGLANGACGEFRRLR